MYHDIGGRIITVYQPTRGEMGAITHSEDRIGRQHLVCIVIHRGLLKKCLILLLDLQCKECSYNYLRALTQTTEY